MDIALESSEYLRLLDECHEEQRYQLFLEQHTRFIPREFIQNHGIGCSLVLRKLSFGADYKSDFFYFSKSTDDWNAVFIEIEKPSSQLFKDRTNVFHADFVKALQQINQWKAWFLSEQNKGSFLAMVSAIQVPHHLAGNPTYNKYVLVFGRRSEYSENVDRRRLVKGLETDDFKIVTFDSLAEGLTGKYEVSIGSRHNQFIDILTDEITDPGLYSWVEPTQLRVSETLYDKLKNGPRSRHFRLGTDGKNEEVFTRAARLVRVRYS
jgi:hypothetical protein